MIRRMCCAAVLAVLAMPLFSATAGACQQPAKGTLAMAWWGDAQPHIGVMADLYQTKGEVAKGDSKGWVAQSLFEGTNDSTWWGAPGARFVEVGYQQGWAGDPSRFTWYWGEKTPYAFIAYRIPTSYAFGKWHRVQVNYVADKTWSIYVDGTRAGRSGNQPPDSRFVTVGMSSSSIRNSLGTGDYGEAAAQTGYIKVDGIMPWFGNATLICTSPHAFARWDNSSNPRRLIDFLNPNPDFEPLGGRPSKAGAAHGRDVLARRGRRHRVTGATKPTLPEVASAQAGVLGDPTPTSAQYVRTTRQAAARLISSATVDTDQEVFLVQLKGSFTHPYSRLPGAKPPSGPTAVITVDADSREVLDLGVMSSDLELAALGEVHELR